MKIIKYLCLIVTTIFFFTGSALLYAAENLQITIKGIQGKTLKNVQDRLSVLQQDDIPLFNKLAPENIRKAMEPFGYFKVEIQSELSSHAILFTITPGPRVMVTQVDALITGEGKNDPELINYLQHFPVKTGKPLSIANYNKATDNLFQIANTQGYLKAYMEKKELIINLKSYTAKIIMHLNTEPRYYFGPVEFNKSPFAPDFLQRFVTFHDQQPFSSQELLKFQQDLGNSQYFQNVIVNPQIDQSKNYLVPIQVETTPRKSQQYNFGIGYGTFTGPRFTAESNWRRVTDTGQHFNMELKLSPVLSGLGAKYFIPGKNPLTEQYTLGANLQQFTPKNGRSFSETLSGGYAETGKEWQHNVALNYLRERFTINDNPWQSSNLLYPSFTITRMKSDSLLNPHFGTSASFNVQGSSDKLLSQINFLQNNLKGKIIVSPTEKSRLIVRGELGYTVVKDLQKLPLSLQFFAGGPNSVRGYKYDSMGPGRYQTVGSIELQHRIIGNWNAAVFYDVGTANNHFNADYQHSRGAGVVYNSIIGPIKVYVARADSTRGKPLRIDFNIGPDF